MYLYRKQYGHKGVTATLKTEREGKTLDLATDRPVVISEMVGEWRKANQIHKWFVDNVQDGKDDCREYHVEREKLHELQDLCRKVIEASNLIPGKVSMGRQVVDGVWTDILEDGKVIEDSRTAQQLLPSYKGFFFGGYDYDEWYIDQLRQTIEIIDTALDHPGWATFSYDSSW